MEKLEPTKRDSMSSPIEIDPERGHAQDADAVEENPFTDIVDTPDFYLVSNLSFYK